MKMKNLKDILEGFFNNVSGDITRDELCQGIDKIIKKAGIRIVDSRNITDLCAYDDDIMCLRSDNTLYQDFGNDVKMYDTKLYFFVIILGNRKLYRKRLAEGKLGFRDVPYVMINLQVWGDRGEVPQYKFKHFEFCKPRSSKPSRREILSGAVTGMNISDTNDAIIDPILCNNTDTYVDALKQIEKIIMTLKKTSVDTKEAAERMLNDMGLFKYTEFAKLTRTALKKFIVKGYDK